MQGTASGGFPPSRLRPGYHPSITGGFTKGQGAILAGIGISRRVRKRSDLLRRFPYLHSSSTSRSRHTDG